MWVHQLIFSLQEEWWKNYYFLTLCRNSLMTISLEASFMLEPRGKSSYFLQGYKLMGGGAYPPFRFSFFSKRTEVLISDHSLPQRRKRKRKLSILLCIIFSPSEWLKRKRNSLLFPALNNPLLHQNLTLTLPRTAP